MSLIQLNLYHVVFFKEKTYLHTFLRGISVEVSDIS